jgi:hypothetical protein
MGYKIFYSYQSDSPHKVNKDFIKDAIVSAIDQVEDFDIEELNVGYEREPQNQPLLETMLDQSEDSDLFIGDMTLTSSKFGIKQRL